MWRYHSIYNNLPFQKYNCIFLNIKFITNYNYYYFQVKLIKTRLRSTMDQGRLESLMFLSCERDIKINYEETITLLGKSSDVLKKALLFKWINIFYRKKFFFYVFWDGLWVWQYNLCLITWWSSPRHWTEWYECCMIIVENEIE